VPVDVGALLERIDVGALMSRVYIDAMLTRVDIEGLMTRIDGARLTAMRLNGFVGRVADRVLLRRTSDRSGLAPREPTGPGPVPLPRWPSRHPSRDPTRDGTAHDPPAQAEALQGGRAGFVSRVADGVDFLVVEVIFLAILLGIAVVRFLVTRKDLSVGAPDVWITLVAQWWIIVVYLGTNWSSTGKTIGKSVLGLRVERMEGGP